VEAGSVAAGKERSGVGPSGTFVRQASGLVRQAGAFDAFIFNSYFINIGMGVAFMILMYALYPGANLVLTTFACLVLVLPTSLLYVMFMSAMPRSGGDYVYVTRSLGPFWGFVSNWNWNMWNLYLMGIAGSFLGIYGISGILRVIAGFTDNASVADAADFVTTPTGTFIISSALVIGLIMLFMFGRGLRGYLKFQKVTFVIATVGLLGAILALLIVGEDGFVSGFNSYADTFSNKGNAHQTILEAGAFKPESFSFSDSMSAVTWPFLVLGFGIASAYIGGEIKTGSHTFLKSVTGSVVYSAVFMALIIAVLFAVVGKEFLGSLGLADPASIGFAFTPTFAELGAAVSGNIVFALIIAVGFALWTYVWMPGYILSWSRSMLAWSLDRLVPAKLGEVDPRREAPVFGLIVLMVGSLISCALYAYTDLLTVLAGAFGEALTFVMVSIAGIVFPYKQRKIWESSPYNQRFFGVPLMSIVAVLSLLGMAIVCLILLTDPNSGVDLTESPRNVIVTLATFASGFVVYAIARTWQRRRGVDVTLAYREIPPE
jgi:amino acid transporter